MLPNKIYLFVLLVTFGSLSSFGQDYFYKEFGPFDPNIPSPMSFLGYDIGEYHTRHDLIVSYFEALDASSDKARLIDYGKTHENRRLVILQISTAEQLSNIETIRARHLQNISPDNDPNSNIDESLSVLVNLGYNVHGNEPSSAEAAMLAAYVMIASNHPDIDKYREESIVFIDPTINPDGRDRHTQWANSYRADQLVADPMDAEHNEMWPRGRTNHYWFDLNRDWLLAVHPESQSKLKWYHDWYPNVVTDFHEMGSSSTYFFEPMKAIGSKDPIMPKENYTTLNDTFAKYYQREMDKLGSLYFTKEVYDGTYPGYGSSYPDLQGGLGILFEQASSRGHVQETRMGKITFPFTIRNQFVNSIATVEASVKHKILLQKYQRTFFESAIEKAKKSNIKYYVFNEKHDKNRFIAFIELLTRHKIKAYELGKNVKINGQNFEKSSSVIVPTEQEQYRMVQTIFETYEEYADSVYYDASAWSLVNAFNINYTGTNEDFEHGELVNLDKLKKYLKPTEKSSYAYIFSWDDYHAPALLYYLQSKGVKTLVAQKPFSIDKLNGSIIFSYGSIVVPIQLQSLSQDSLWSLIKKGSIKFDVNVESASTGLNIEGVDLGSRQNYPTKMPKAIMLIGEGTSSYEAGFVWHLLDQRIKMPITKVSTNMFGRVNLRNYNTMVLVSGNYNSMDTSDINKIKDWVAEGNTLITIGTASRWAIKKRIVNESLVEDKVDKKDSSAVKRSPYVMAREIKGKNEVGGTIFQVDVDITHPIAYGYRNKLIPIYRNNNVWLKPSKNEFSNVAVYTDEPHIDGFITDETLEKYLKKSASIVVSKVGSGRAILFAEDPNFRGIWYGTNKLFLNSMFFGELIRVP